MELLQRALQWLIQWGMVMLPIFKDMNKNLMLLQTNWSALLNPLLKAPTSQGVLLPGIKLINGVNVINHLLQRTLQGWYFTDITGAAEVYRSAPKNDLTLTLTSNAAVTVDIFVF